MDKIEKIQVYIADKHVGTLALRNNKCAFQYTSYWLDKGFALDPINLPLRDKLFTCGYEPFEGLFGVFYDSLPDGWGRLLVDRMLLSNGENPATIDVLQRLAIVGSSGHGCLEYVPEYKFEHQNVSDDFDKLCLDCQKILDSKECDDLDELFVTGGSSGGARPKALIDIDGEPWIVKFWSSYDPKNIGKMEFDYFTCAKKCGLNVPETRLIKSKICNGHFAVKRFDRVKGNKVHMISASALLGVSHRIPSLDYNNLMQLTLNLTQDFNQVKDLYKLMCFNVYAHNRDDHSNNFSYLYDEKWMLSPVYDLTYSSSIGGEHATTINGNGVNPKVEDLISVAKKIGLDDKWAKDIALEIKEIVNANLASYIV